jgi:Outer membrane protein
MLLSVVFTATAQSGYDAVLTQIEANSTTLQALREQMEAQKLGNRTGIFLSNPEVEFNYLWGSPSAIGNRTDFAVKQSLDFPTAYGHRNQISKLENTNAELAYKAERINLLLRAKQVCIELVYYNSLVKEYGVRLENAEQIADAYKTKLENGEANAIENNKAQMNLTAVQNEVTLLETERSILLSELKRLNGGQNIDFTQNSYSGGVLPENFDDWYSYAETESPTLEYVSGQISISEKQTKLNRALGLPKFTAGYMSEKVVGERFQGVLVGVSIPLWENKNKVKQARAQMSANQSMLADTKVQFYNRLQGLYMKATNLQQSASKYRAALSAFNNESLLKKALDAGEVSLLNYLMEIEYYYGAVNNVLKAEKDFELSFAELSAVEL